jgi:hypothetical protein
MITDAVRIVRETEHRLGAPPAWIEVSGGITLATIRERTVPGVDLISVGALTHSAAALDLSLELELDLERDLERDHERGLPAARHEVDPPIPRPRPGSRS